MRISCVLKADEIGAPSPDLILFPEGIAWSDIHEANACCQDAIVIGAVVENGKSRAVLWHRRENRIDYLKVDSDGRTEGSGSIYQNPVYETGGACIGVLVCMDVNNGIFSHRIVEGIKASSAPLKLICIPADMGSHWFDGLRLPTRQFDGVHVILCNHTKTHQVRCKSFAANTEGMKTAIQIDNEPLHVDVR